MLASSPSPARGVTPGAGRRPPVRAGLSPPASPPSGDLAASLCFIAQPGGAAEGGLLDFSEAVPLAWGASLRVLIWLQVAVGGDEVVEVVEVVD